VLAGEERNRRASIIPAALTTRRDRDRMWVVPMTMPGALRADVTHTRSRRPPLRAYVEYRLGRKWKTQLVTWLTKTWGAASFDEFWIYFNPVYGYALSYWVYRPLRRVLPPLLAVWLTFVASGFLLHDAVGWLIARDVRFPEMTLVFVLFGLGASGAKAVGMDIARQPFVARAAANVGYVVICFAAVQTIR
jgi:hypothetical protein